MYRFVKGVTGGAGVREQGEYLLLNTRNKKYLERDTFPYQSAVYIQLLLLLQCLLICSLSVPYTPPYLFLISRLCLVILSKPFYNIITCNIKSMPKSYRLSITVKYLQGKISTGKKLYILFCHSIKMMANGSYVKRF